MATVPVLSIPIPRDELKKFLPNFQLIKAFENMSQDVSVTLPDSINGNTDAVELAQATADAAIVQATAAQADADAAQADIDAFQLRDVPLALTDAATILVDATAHNSFFVTLGGNRTLGAPTGLVDGMLLNFAIHQPAVGGPFTLTFNAIYDFGAAGTPVLSKPANAVDYVSGYYDAGSGKILATFRKAQSLSASFSAHNNGVAQSIPSGAVTALNLSTTAFNAGGFFAANAWVPPAGRPIMLTGAVTMPAAVGFVNQISILKNGVSFKVGEQVSSSVVTTHVLSMSCIDIPNGTDSYQLAVSQNTGVAQNTGGAANLTWFQGTTIQS